VLKQIMGDIFKAYATSLEAEFIKLDFFSPAGKERLLIDVQYYIAKLGALEGVDGPGNRLEVIVNSLKVKSKPSIDARRATSVDLAGRTSVDSNVSSAGSSSGRKYSLWNRSGVKE
jgi:vacuolar protein sorting-associated protein 54